MSLAAAARCPLAHRATPPAACSTSYTRRPGLPVSLPARGAASASHSNKQQPRQERQLRLAALSGSSGGSSGGDGENVFAQALREYDGFIDQSLKTVEEGRNSLKELDEELVRMRDDSVLPKWIINIAAWSRRLGQEGVVESQKRYDALRAKRAEFAAALRQLEAEQAQQAATTGTTDGEADLTGADITTTKLPNGMAADVLALTGYTWAQAQEDGEDLGGSEKLAVKLREALVSTTGPNSILWVCVSSCLLTAWLAGLAGGWAGYDAYRLLHEAPSPEAAAVWLGWTAPYVLGTLAANSAAPGVLNKSIFRPLTADQQTFFRKIPFLNFAACAAVVSFCQCLTYQGLWQDVFTALLGGVRDPLLDPYIEQPIMGTLVGGRLPAFVVAPSAAVLTGTLEAAWYFSALALRDTSTTIVLGSDKLEAKEWMEGPFGNLDATTISAEERLLVCARVALAGTFLALETSLTGNLWFAVGTSTAGMITSVLLSQRTHGAKRT